MARSACTYTGDCDSGHLAIQQRAEIFFLLFSFHKKTSRLAMSVVALGRGVPPRLCAFSGWELVDAALSTAVALLQLLVVRVLNISFVLCKCGANLASVHKHQCCLPAVIGAASVVNVPVVMLTTGLNSLVSLAFIHNVNGGLPGQPAMSLLLQRSEHRRPTESANLFFTWRTAFSLSSICCAKRQRRF